MTAAPKHRRGSRNIKFKLGFAGMFTPKYCPNWVRNFVGKMFDRDPKLYQSYSERERSGIFTQNTTQMGEEIRRKEACPSPRRRIHIRRVGVRATIYPKLPPIDSIKRLLNSSAVLYPIFFCLLFIAATSITTERLRPGQTGRTMLGTFIPKISVV